MIKLQDGQFGTYLIVNAETGQDILIDIDYDFIGIARDFGWNKMFGSIQEAREYLDDNIGKIVEDPGYFDA